MSRQLIQLAISLINRTQSGSLQWEEGPTDTTYIAQIGENSVSIRPLRDDYVITVFNENGSVVETFSDVNLLHSGMEGAFDRLRDLYDMARRNALGADTVINDILKRLSS